METEVLHKAGLVGQERLMKEHATASQLCRCKDQNLQRDTLNCTT